MDSFWEMEACHMYGKFDSSPTLERRGSPVVRTLAYHAAGPSSIPGLGGENY